MTQPPLAAEIPQQKEEISAPCIVEELTEAQQRELSILQTLIEPCDRITYGDRLREAAEALGCSVRTVQRKVKRWEKEGVAALVQSGRADRGQHRIAPFWQEFIVKTYETGNKGSRRMKPKQVAVRVQAKAREMGDDKPPSYKTVLRILQPIIDRKKQAKSIRSPGWRGSTLSVKTREGQDLSVEYSNHVWQCDHTRADVLLVDQYGELLGRPWLTTVIDTYSRCIMGINLSI
jgi:putative transposase